MNNEETMPYEAQLIKAQQEIEALRKANAEMGAAVQQAVLIALELKEKVRQARELLEDTKGAVTLPAWFNRRDAWLEEGK